MTAINFYTKETEKAMLDFYNNLNERDRRHFSALSVMQLPHGGNKYISSIFNINPRTIYDGKIELQNEKISNERIRKKGGGRKPMEEIVPNINTVFLEILKNHTAGDPMNEKIIYTDLTMKEISEKMKEEGITVSKKYVGKLLKKNKYVKRKIQKKKKINDVPYRNDQFEKIAELKENYAVTKNPIISVDGKKKEKLGELYRDGKVFSKEVVESYDHDYPYLSDGSVTMYSIYDIERNEGFVSIGSSKETSEMACNAIKNWWDTQGKKQYPNAVSILVLADSGGSNSSRHNIFKQDLCDLASEIGIEIRMAHYPPYSSKWNPIEHRLFPHITRSMSGLMLRSYDMVKHLVEKTVTATGLKVKAIIDDFIYEIGRKVDKDFSGKKDVLHDDFLPNLNYTALP